MKHLIVLGISLIGAFIQYQLKDKNEMAALIGILIFGIIFIVEIFYWHKEVKEKKQLDKYLVKNRLSVLKLELTNELKEFKNEKGGDLVFNGSALGNIPHWLFCLREKFSPFQIILMVAFNLITEEEYEHYRNTQ